jgi:hypothetical protein
MPLIFKCVTTYLGSLVVDIAVVDQLNIGPGAILVFVEYASNAD